MKIEYINDLSIYRQIVDNSRNPLESIREFISNSWDAKSTEVEISISYNYKTNGIDMIFKNNGQGLDVDEIRKLILGAGHSTKKFEDENIGNKGIGTLLYLKCKKITINSKKDNIISKVTWNNPYEFLLDPINAINDITSEIEESKDNEEDYLEVYMESYLAANNITKFHHKKVKDYIQRFTRVGTIENQFDDNYKEDFTVKLKGLEYEEYDYKSYHEDSICILRRGSKDDSLYANIIDTAKDWEIIPIGFKMPKPTTRNEIVELLLNDKSIRDAIGDKKYESIVKRKINENIVLKMTHELQELSQYKEVEYEDTDSKIKKSELKFVIYKIGQVAREAFDDILQTKKRKKSYNESIKSRYGAFLCKDNFAICKIDAEHLPRLGNGPDGETQYLALFNNDDISLIMDRTAPSVGTDLIEQVYFNIHDAMKKADILVKEEVDTIKNMLNKKLSEETMDELPLIGYGKDKTGNDESEGIDNGLNIGNDESEGIDNGLNIGNDKSEGIDDGLNTGNGKSEGIDDGLNIGNDKSEGIDNGLNIGNDKSEGIDDGLNTGNGKSEGIDDGLNIGNDKSEGIDNVLNIGNDESEGINSGLNKGNDGCKSIGIGNDRDEYKKFKLEEKKLRVTKHKNRKCLTLYNGVKIFDANNEAEVQMELIKVVSVSPDILPFDILDYNANRGIDMLAIDKNADRENLENYYYVELKDKLQSNMNHNMSYIKYILCWEISHALRKSWEITDNTGSLYKISKDGDWYVAKSNNNYVQIIELKPLIEKKFNKYFE